MEMDKTLRIIESLRDQLPEQKYIELKTAVLKIKPKHRTLQYGATLARIMEDPPKLVILRGHNETWYNHQGQTIYGSLVNPD
jgi:hypothetical protein